MIFYPPRKVLGAFGAVFFGLFVFALYRYSQAHKITFVVLAVLTLCIAIYQLSPVLRNQIVEITSDSIIVSSFGKKTILTKANLYEIEYHHCCIAAYQFDHGKQYYQITPIAYKNGSVMLQEFKRLFGS